jgi:hypothetical protein
MNKLVEATLQYREPDEYDNIKVVRVHLTDAINQMKNYAYQHGYAYTDDVEALQEFIALHWAEWVEKES